MTLTLSILKGKKESTGHLLKCAALFTHGQQSQLIQAYDELVRRQRIVLTSKSIGLWSLI